MKKVYDCSGDVTRADESLGRCNRIASDDTEGVIAVGFEPRDSAGKAGERQEEGFVRAALLPFDSVFSIRAGKVEEIEFKSVRKGRNAANVWRTRAFFSCRGRYLSQLHEREAFM